jgi:branched-chain amino acid transport system ATP-binding protein
MSSKPTSEQKLLEVKNVSAHYGRARALSGITFDIPEGIIAGFIGANGAGKTTLLKIISGLLKPSDGEVWYRGVRIDKLKAHEIIRYGIAHVPEGCEIFKKITVRENLEIGSYTQKDKGKITEAMERVFKHFPILKERRNQKAGTLSGGEQQMLAISRGLMSSPKLLLSDEPSLGLSPIMIEEIGKIIKDIHMEGTTILLVEQNALLALRLSQKAFVLETGNLIMEGETDELLHNEEIKKAYIGI